MIPLRRIFVTGLAALAAAACTPLQVFEAVNPPEQGVVRVASASYGAGLRQGLDVYAPAKSTRPLPVVVFFYGGSWDSGDRAEYAFAGEAIASKGFLVAVPDYRLYPEVRFPAFLDDGAAAIRWVRDNAARLGGDPARILLAGHSAGAYNAAMLALDGRYLRRAGVDPAVIRGVAGLSGPYDFLPLDDPTTIKVFGDAPDKPATQPVRFARAGMPAFLATGDTDTTVEPRHTAALSARLREAGSLVTERVYRGLDHADTLLALSVLLRRKAPVLKDMTEFLAQQAAARPVVAAAEPKLRRPRPAPPPAQPDATGTLPEGPPASARPAPSAEPPVGEEFRGTF